MPSILNTGLSGLLSFQRALGTTAHNVSNATTEGYSRQRTELQPRPGQPSTNGHVGRGVDATGVDRIRDRFVEARLQSAISDDGRTRMQAELAGSLDNLLASSDTGLAPALSGFFASLQDLANDPSGATWRQFALTEASSLVERFRFLDDAVQGLEAEMNVRAEGLVVDINAAATQLARLNREITLSLSQGAGATPNDLLDQRDLEINRLGALVGIRTVSQENGALNVFSSSGQALVVDGTALPWQTVQDPADPASLQIADSFGGIISDKLSGGELGGLLDFRRESLSAARNELGRVATVLADTFNAQHRAGMDALGDLGQDFFSVASPQVIAHAGNGGAAAVTATITDSSQLTTSDYRLDYDGTNYTLTRSSDGTAISGAGPLAMDGIQVTIGAGAVSGDRYLVRPVANGAAEIALAFGNPDRLAAAVPVRGGAGPGNVGNGVNAQPTVSDVTDPALSNDVQIVFNDPPTTFDVVDLTAGSVLAAGVAFSPGGTIAANGWSTSITGAPAAGDLFRVEANTGGISDNRNALALAGLQTERFIEGRLSPEEGYSTFVGRVGVTARAAQFNAEVGASLLADAQLSREAVSGVNLDEEAVDLTRYQQAYQAMARVIETANSLFDSVLAAIR